MIAPSPISVTISGTSMASNGGRQRRRQRNDSRQHYLPNLMCTCYFHLVRPILPLRTSKRQDITLSCLGTEIHLFFCQSHLFDSIWSPTKRIQIASKFQGPTYTENSASVWNCTNLAQQRGQVQVCPTCLPLSTYQARLACWLLVYLVIKHRQTLTLLTHRISLCDSIQKLS